MILLLSVSFNLLLAQVLKSEIFFDDSSLKLSSFTSFKYSITFFNKFLQDLIILFIIICVPISCELEDSFDKFFSLIFFSIISNSSRS